MKNMIQPGNAWNHICAVAVLSGSVVVMGKTAGVAATSGEIGDEIAVSMTGVFALPKTAGLAIVQGERLYWKADTEEITATATGNVQIGYASAPAAADATTVNVSLIPA